MPKLDFTERLRAWSVRQQGLDRSFADPMALLERITGVYSTNPSGALSLLARVSALTPERALSLDKASEAVRFPNMHGSTHLVPLHLAGTIFGATRDAPARFMPQLRAVGLDLAGYEALKPRLLALLQEPIDARTIKKTLDIGAAEVVAIRQMTRELLVLRVAGSVRTDQLSYVATETWLGRTIAPAEPDLALRQLAERYLRGFGPARIKDLAWWIPASQSRVRAALAELDLVQVAPDYLLPADLEDAFQGVAPLDPDAIGLLPKWDAWTMGYAPDGRARIAHDQHLPHAYSTAETSANKASGDGWPLILRGGRAIARWESRYNKSALEVTITPFPGERIADAAIQPGFERIAAFLGCADLRLSRSST